MLPAAVVAIVSVLAFCKRDAEDVTFRRNSGFVFGTSYNITYQSAEDYETEIKAVMDSVDLSLSPFNKNSIISAVNENKDVEVDDNFINVFTLAKEVNAKTDGAFDITVAPLVNAWGFGFKDGKFPNAREIDSLRAIVGLEKVRLEGRKVIKADRRIMLDCSAIAKGYAVDKVAEMLGRKGVSNYLVEIGGEIVARGHNAKNKEWSIGITKPVDDSLSLNNSLQNIITITDCAIATSGNYRNYYIKDGHKYSHTIDPKTGYPAETDLLSVTIIAKTCAEADAYATGFMTSGRQKALAILKSQPEKRYILYYDEDGQIKSDIQK